MGVEEQRGTVLTLTGANGPHVVGLAVGHEAAADELFFHDVGGAALVAAHRGGGNEMRDQTDGLAGVLLCCHRIRFFLFFLFSYKINIIFSVVVYLSTEKVVTLHPI